MAVVLVGHWTSSLDRPRLDRVLRGELPFAELTMLDDEDEVEPVPERHAQLV